MNVPPTLSRRRLLELSAAGAATVSAASFALPSAAAAATDETTTPLPLRRSTWTPLIGETVTVDGVGLRLDAVADVAGVSRRRTLVDHEDAFVLSLSGPSEPALDSGIHTVLHADGSSEDLFLSPVPAAADGRQGYEVLVDRTVQLPAKQMNALVSRPSTAKVAGGELAGVASAVFGPFATMAAAPAKALGARLRVRATARRRGGRLEAQLRFPGGGISSVRVKVLSHGKVVARGGGLVRGDRAAFVLHGVGAKSLRRGRYDLSVTATDAKGAASSAERSLSVR